MESIDITLLGNSLESWLGAVAATVVAFTLLGLINRSLSRRLSAIARLTKPHLDDDVASALQSTKTFFLLILSVYIGSRFVTLPERPERIIDNVTVVALIVQAGIWAAVFLTAALDRYRERKLDTDPASVTTVGAVGFIGKLVLWTVVLLLALENLGFDITALIAGLGVGGIAVALAVQNILGDLLATLSIVLDKPFAVGDFLIVDDFLGSVESVGLKTTRIRSLSGEQLVFSNSDLLSSRLRNYGRMYERRVAFNIGVTYQTPRDKLKQIPAILRDSIEAQHKTRFDRAHFKAYGDFALDFEAVYYVLEPDYNLYMDIQQAVNLAIHERFEEQRIEFAYPTQTLHLVSEHAPAAA